MIKHTELSLRKRDNLGGFTVEDQWQVTTGGGYNWWQLQIRQQEPHLRKYTVGQKVLICGQVALKEGEENERVGECWPLIKDLTFVQIYAGTRNIGKCGITVEGIQQQVLQLLSSFDANMIPLKTEQPHFQEWQVFPHCFRGSDSLTLYRAYFYFLLKCIF